MMKLASPFDFVKLLSYTKEKISHETFDEHKHNYIPFIINRAFSYYLNLIFITNEMNLNSLFLEPKLQYDFYFNIIRKEKRYSKWHKKKNIEEIKKISEKYKCNFLRAKEIFHILNMKNVNIGSEYE